MGKDYDNSFNTQTYQTERWAAIYRDEMKSHTLSATPWAHIETHCKQVGGTTADM